MKSILLLLIVTLGGCSAMPICPEIKLAMCPAEAR